MLKRSSSPSLSLTTADAVRLAALVEAATRRPLGVTAALLAGVGMQPVANDRRWP